MMFIHIVPEIKGITPIEANDLDDLREFAGLKDSVDFAAIAPDLSIIVSEFGLLEDDGLGYFAIGRQLFAGNAIIFGVAGNGDTASVTDDDLRQIIEHTSFYPNAKEAEAAIVAGEIDRPSNYINGDIYWEWKA